MKHYFSIEGRLYILTDRKLKKWEKLFPEIDSEREDFADALSWIEENGKYIDVTTVYHY